VIEYEIRYPREKKETKTLPDVCNKNKKRKCGEKPNKMDGPFLQQKRKDQFFLGNIFFLLRSLIRLIVIFLITLSIYFANPQLEKIH
jgi:hypothetical protein